MNTLTKLAINKKISAIFADGTSKMNLNIATVSRLLSGVDRVAVEVAPFDRASKLLTDLAESAGRQVTQNDGDGTLLVRSVIETKVEPEPVVEEPPVVEQEPVAWNDMSDEQRAEVIADEPVAEAPEPEAMAAVEQVAEAFQQLAPKAKAPKAKATKAKAMSGNNYSI
jgi:hypothetical protein